MTNNAKGSPTEARALRSVRRNRMKALLDSRDFMRSSLKELPPDSPEAIAIKRQISRTNKRIKRISKAKSA